MGDHSELVERERCVSAPSWAVPFLFLFRLSFRLNGRSLRLQYKVKLRGGAVIFVLRPLTSFFMQDHLEGVGKRCSDVQSLPRLRYQPL